MLKWWRSQAVLWLHRKYLEEDCEKQHPETFIVKTELRDLPYHRKESYCRATLETSSSLSKQWPFDKQCEKKNNNKQLLAHNVTKWPCYYNWPNLSPALRLGLHWQALSRNLFCINEYHYLKKREVLTSLNFTCCCSLSTESVIAFISDAPYFCWIMFSIPLSNASST